MTNLTLEFLLKRDSNVSANIEFAHSFYPPCPEKPNKPIAIKVGTSYEVRKYADKLEQWELATTDYKEAHNEYLAVRKEVDAILDEYIKHQANFDAVPDHYKEKVWRKAYQDGHSGGHSEIFNCLCDLVGIFE